MSDNPYLDHLQANEPPNPIGAGDPVMSSDGAPRGVDNPYLSHLQQQDGSYGALVLRDAIDYSPDEAADAAKIARKRGLPSEVVQGSIGDFKQLQTLEDTQNLLKNAPITAAAMRDPRFARMSHDDVPHLTKIEKAVGSVASYVMGAREDGGLPGDIKAGVGQALFGFGGKVYSGLSSIFATSDQILQRIDDAAANLTGTPKRDIIGGPLQLETKLTELAKNAERDAKAFAPELAADAGNIRKGLRSGFESTGQQLPALVAGLMTGSAAVGVAGAGIATFGDSYQRARDQGKDAFDAVLYGLEDATAEVVTEKYLGLGKLIKDAGAGMGLGRMLMRDIIREIPGESAATVWQNFNEWLNLNPEKPAIDWLNEQPDAIAQTIVATAVSVGAQTGSARAIQKGIDRLSGADEQRARAEQAAGQIEDLIKLGEAAKLKTRDAETFREFVQQVADEQGDEPKEFYADSEQVANVLNQSGMSMVELEAIAPVVAKQVQNAQTGTDVRIPVSELMLLGEKVTAPLVDHLRTEADGMSRAEAKQWMSERGDQIKADMESAIAEQNKTQEFQDSIAQVRAEFLSELQTIKRFTDPVNEAYADLLSNFYGATASRLGITPGELLQRYRLKIAGQGAAATYDQSAPDADPLAAVPFSAFNGEMAGGLDRIFLSDEHDGSPVSLNQQGFTPEEVSALEAAGLATDGKMSREQWARYSDEKTLRDRGGRGSSAKDTVAADDATLAAAKRRAEERRAKGANNQGSEAKAPPRAQISLPGNFSNGPAIISLLKDADLSSFIHESGHLFLEVQADIAQQIQQRVTAGEEVTPQEVQILEDFNKLLDWFGIKGDESVSPLEAWSRMSMEDKTTHHEQFARGFEAFAFEGNAPNIALQSVFQRFRSWLVQVYKSLTQLNVSLTDDVRDVMGRMLATDQAIEEAEAQRMMGPLFRDEKSAGMTLEEFQKYQAVAQQATDKAKAELSERALKDMKWLGRARDKALKARQQEVEELRRDVRSEVRMEVLAEPVYRAWTFLTAKEDGGKLNTDALKAKYGTAEDATWRKLSARRMSSSEGMDPDVVAQQFGFDSGDALIQALAEATPPNEAIEARTDQRMLEMFGDITSPEAMRRAADEAIHNDIRARLIASELKALQDATTVREDTGKRTRTGRRVTIDALAKAAKDYAQQIVSRLTVRELRPGQYTAAEARNARLAEKAFAAGKTEEAAMHKRNQLVNHNAAKAAMEALEEVKKAQRYFKKFDKRSKSIDPAYMDQIEALLEKYDFKTGSLKAIDKRKSFREWYDEQVANGIEPDVPDKLLNDSGKQSYKDMTLEEIRGLVDTIKQIEHMGRLKRKLLTARDKRDFDAIAEEVTASIIANGGEAKDIPLEGQPERRRFVQSFLASHRKLGSLIRQMDGGNENGPLYRAMGRAMIEAGTKEDTMLADATAKLSDLYAPMVAKPGGLKGKKSMVFVKEIGASLTRAGRLAVALNWGNAQNRQRLLDGRKWTEAQAQAVLKTLDAEELAFVNQVWEYLDSYWPEVAAKEKRITGVEPDKVEAVSFEATASDGTKVQMRGGYYPLKYDTEASDKADQQDQAQVAKDMMQGAFVRSTTRRGHTKARVENVKRPVKLDLDVITQHVTQVVHDLAWHEWLIDANKMLGDERVSDAIRLHYSPEILRTIRDSVRSIAAGDTVAQTALDRTMLRLRANITRSVMGLSLTTAMLQPFGLTQSMVRIGTKWVLKGGARWMGDAARMQSSMKWIGEKSEFMRLRAQTFNRELREIKKTVDGTSKTMRVIDASLFMLMTKMQMIADVPTWIGQYEKALAEGNDEAAAITLADRAVIDAQGGGHTKDLSEVQRKHPFLTQFYSYFSTTWNLNAEATARTDFKSPSAVAGWLADMTLLNIIPAIGPALMLFALKGGGEDDEPEDWAMRVLKWQVGFLMSQIVGIREFTGGIEGFDYAGPPAGRLIGDTIKLGKQIAQGEVDEPLVMAMIRVTSDIFGIPAAQAIRSYKGWQAWSEGDAPPSSILFGPPPKD